MDADYIQRSLPPVFMNGLPLNKPPYAHLVSIDLNKGDIRWRVPFGDMAELRKHPALAGIQLPDRLGAPGPAGAIVTKGGLVFMGSGDTALYAFDKVSGREIWSAPLTEAAQATPMTFQSSSGRQFVVIATGRADRTALVAFALE